MSVHFSAGVFYRKRIGGPSSGVMVFADPEARTVDDVAVRLACRGRHCLGSGRAQLESLQRCSWQLVGNTVAMRPSHRSR